MHLKSEYRLSLQRYADLRALAVNEDGSAARNLSESVVKQISDIYVGRDVSDFDHTKWLTEELSTECITFASKDVYASIEMHKQLVPTWVVTDMPE